MMSGTWVTNTTFEFVQIHLLIANWSFDESGKYGFQLHFSLIVGKTRWEKRVHSHATPIPPPKGFREMVRQISHGQTSLCVGRDEARTISRPTATPIHAPAPPTTRLHPRSTAPVHRRVGSHPLPAWSSGSPVGVGSPGCSCDGRAHLPTPSAGASASWLSGRFGPNT